MSPVFAALAVAGFAWLTVFQTILASGARWGHLAWGGAETVLSRPRRLASLAVAALAIAGAASAATVLSHFGMLSEGPFRIVHGGLAVLFGFSLLANLASGSRPERLHGVPLSAILAVSNGALAWAGP